MEKLLLFDVDGVIMDFFEINYQTVIDFLKRKNLNTITEEQFRKAFERNGLANILKYAGIEKVEDISQKELDILIERYQEVAMFPGMKLVLSDLAEHHVLVVVTSTMIDAISKQFEKYELLDLFSAYLGPKAAVHKDKKILMALEEFAKKPEETCFISDTSGDLLEAKKTGVQTIGVTWGYHDEDTIKKASPDYIVKTPQELYERLHLL